MAFIDIAASAQTRTGPLNVAQSASSLVRDFSGNLYFTQWSNILAVRELQVFKSINNGLSWTVISPAAPYVTSQTSGLISSAIDSNNIIHIFLIDNSSASGNYLQFNTSTNLFQNFAKVPMGGVGLSSIAIAVDRNNIAHVAISSSGNNKVFYNNFIAGYWLPTAVTVASPTAPVNVDILIDQNNVPQVSYINTAASTGVTAAIGNKNNATSFTVQAVATGFTTAGGASLALDSKGNTWLAYQAGGSGPITLQEHLQTSAWSSWQTAVQDGNPGNAVSLAILGTDIYVFYERYAGGIAYDRYNSIQGNWLGENILQPPANKLTLNAKSALPFVKWSNYFDNYETGANNQNSNFIDYVFNYSNPITSVPNTVAYGRLDTGQISTGFFNIVFSPSSGTTTSTSTSASSTSSSLSTSTSTSISSTSSSTSQSTSTSQSSTSASTSQSTSTSQSSTSSSTSTSQSSTSASTSHSTSTSQSSTSSSVSTTQSTSTSQSSTSASVSTSTSISSTSSSVSTSQSSTSASTSVSSTSTSVSFTTSTSSTSSSISTTQSTSTSISSTSSSTSQSTSTSQSSTSASISISTSTSHSTTSQSTSVSTSTSQSSTSASTSVSTSTSASSTSASTSQSTSTSQSSTSASTSKSTSTSISSTSSSTSLSTSTSTTIFTTSTSMSTSSSTSTTTLPHDARDKARIKQPELRGDHFYVRYY